MTSKILCSVFDIKGKFYSNPFTAINEASAIREFNTAYLDPNTNINKYPEDYRLFEVGLFNDYTGAVTELDQPKLIASAIDFVKE